ncbi:MAG: hypothetical protein ABSC89_08245 [Verrucomicrobiota bacterium]|jgi:hypothetical protein
MKQDHSKNAIVQAAADAKACTPTLLEFADTIQFELASSVNVAVVRKPAKRRQEMPQWVQKITDGFRRTIFKPVLKLKPKRKMDWQNYGKIIGVLSRQETFFTVDIPRICKEEGLDKITAKQWAKIFPETDEAKLRQRIIKELKRPVSDGEPMEKLAEEVMAQRIAGLEMQKQIALQQVAQQSAKNHAKFLKGFAQGYELFFDDQCGLCGDRGRTQILLDLLMLQYDIEKMRRTLPARSLTDLQSFVGQSFKFPPDAAQAKKWFKEVCDDICLSMKGRGRPHKLVNPQMAPTI